MGQRNLSSPNILIVESDPSQTELAMDLIKDIVRAKIDSTNSGERAIELITKTTYQLIVADSGVGDLDGLSLLERIKRISPSTSVIVTSSYANIEEAVKSVRSGAEEYFKKPYNPEHFKLAVHRCLDRRDLYTGDQSVTGLMLLLNACQLVSSCLEEEKVLETVVGFVSREISPKGIALFKSQAEATTSGVSAAKPDKRIRIPTSADVDADVVEVLVEGNNFIQTSVEEKVPLKIFPSQTTMPEVAIFQFNCVGDSKYFIVCLAPTWKISPEEVASRFRFLQAQVQMTGRSIYNYRGVQHLLYLDEPTGLFNTRYLHARLNQYFDKRPKGDVPVFSVLFIDVDKFKSINDQYGHLVGTRLLFEMGQIIKRHLKKNDTAYRYGGDEFVVILDGVTSENAFAFAEKLRLDVEGTKFLAREGLNVKLTISVGVANCPEHAMNKPDIINAADGAMYAVKRSSRNRVYVAEKKAA